MNPAPVDCTGWSTFGEQVTGALVCIGPERYAVHTPEGRVALTQLLDVTEIRPRVHVGAARAALARRLADTRHWSTATALMWQAWDQLETEETLHDNPTAVTGGAPDAPRPTAPVHPSLLEN